MYSYSISIPVWGTLNLCTVYNAVPILIFSLLDLLSRSLIWFWWVFYGPTTHHRPYSVEGTSEHVNYVQHSKTYITIKGDQLRTFIPTCVSYDYYPSYISHSEMYLRRSITCVCWWPYNEPKHVNRERSASKLCLIARLRPTGCSV